jgi:hypothetical protein
VYARSATVPQIGIVNGATTADLSLDPAGDLTVSCSGADLNFSSVDRVHVLNTTASADTSTGSLTTGGGIGAAGTIHCSRLTTHATSIPSVLLGYDVADYSQMGVTSDGGLWLRSVGSNPKICLECGAGGTRALTCTAAETIAPAALTVMGRAGYGTEGSFNLTAGGPWHNFDIDAAAGKACVTYNVRVVAASSGGHITGIIPGTGSRYMNIYFTATAGPYTVYIDHESALSTATNRILTQDGGTMSIVAGAVPALVALEHVPGIDRWIVSRSPSVSYAPTLEVVDMWMTGAAFVNLTITLSKIGNQVTAIFGGFSVAPAPMALDSIHTGSGADKIPASYRPPQELFWIIWVINGGDDVYGSLRVRTDGGVDIWKACGDNFGNLGDVGLVRTTLSWLV